MEYLNIALTLGKLSRGCMTPVGVCTPTLALTCVYTHIQGTFSSAAPHPADQLKSRAYHHPLSVHQMIILISTVGVVCIPIKVLGCAESSTHLCPPQHHLCFIPPLLCCHQNQWSLGGMGLINFFLGVKLPSQTHYYICISKTSTVVNNYKSHNRK